eukprot:GHUV01054928.1.p1 GENE.GHUV01054928.1~~GHUV01054928.1.p1  ORF type:complete len:151 (+),score=44.95 GHUV01054928.1:617-1069(+)
MIENHDKVFIHPSSVLSELTAGQLQQPHVVYLEKTKTTRVFLREVSVASPLSLILFSNTLKVQHDSGIVVLGDWLQIKVPAVTAVLLKRLREAVDHVLTATVAASNHTSGDKNSGGVGVGDRGGLLAQNAVAVMGLVQQLLASEVAEAGR